MLPVLARPVNGWKTESVLPIAAALLANQAIKPSQTQQVVAVNRHRPALPDTSIIRSSESVSRQSVRPVVLPVCVKKDIVLNATAGITLIMLTVCVRNVLRRFRIVRLAPAHLRASAAQNAIPVITSAAVNVSAVRQTQPVREQAVSLVNPDMKDTTILAGSVLATVSMQHRVGARTVSPVLKEKAAARRESILTKWELACFAARQHLNWPSIAGLATAAWDMSL